MDQEIVLTNDSQRKEFLDNYLLPPWSHIRHDDELGLDFYRVYLSDGSFITVIDSRRGDRIVPITTLTRSGSNYFPTWTTQGELLAHLRNVAGKRSNV